MARREVDVAAMLGSQLAKVSESDTDGEVRKIPLDKIQPNPLNFYPAIDGAAMLELMDSIEANGLLEPPTVVADGESYRLISGHNRIAALRRLRDRTGSNQYDLVLCRILPEMRQDQEVSAVIEANRQRVKSGALLAEEAQRLTEAYVKRREAGEELPGRIRDRVAEAMQISKTKLANLSVIKNGIKVPGIMRSWEEDKIPEAAALEIARLSVEAQYRLLDYVIDGDHDYSIRNVKKFVLMWNACQKECPETGKFCSHAEEIADHDFHGGEWHGAGCCQQCLNRNTCPAACPYARSEAPMENAGEEDPDGDELEETGKINWTDRCKLIGDRLRACRERMGLNRAAFAEKIGAYKATYSAWENGSLPGSSQLPDLARALGVSTDYLYGLTDDPSPKPAPVAWQLLDKDHWPADQQLVILCWDNGLDEWCYATARCVGGYYDNYPFEDTSVGCYLDEPSNGEYDVGYWWIPLPEMEDQHESDDV